MAKLLVKPLARWGDPYVKANGVVIQPDKLNGGTEDGPLKSAAASFRSRKKRTAKDLPAPTGTLNGIACVFMYTALGLGDREIADLLGIKVTQLKQLREHPAYAECFEAVVGEFINVNSDMIHARIAAYGHDALTEIVNVSFKGKDERNRLRGSTFLLKAGGHGNDQNTVNISKNDLRIVFINKSDDMNMRVELG